MQGRFSPACAPRPPLGNSHRRQVGERRFSFAAFTSIYRILTLRRVAGTTNSQARSGAVEVQGLRRMRRPRSTSPDLRTTRLREIQRPGRFMFLLSLGGIPEPKEVRLLSNGQAPT